MSEGNAAVTQADTTAAREWFDQAERDGMIRRGSRKDISLVRILASHRALGASEERARSATTSDETARLRSVVEFAGDIRWRELAEGSPLTVIDRQLLAEMHHMARSSGVLAALQSQDIPS